MSDQCPRCNNRMTGPDEAAGGLRSVCAGCDKEPHACDCLFRGLCEATTTAGTKCLSAHLDGSPYCKRHQTTTGFLSNDHWLGDQSREEAGLV